jgi:phasin family protein
MAVSKTPKNLKTPGSAGRTATKTATKTASKTASKTRVETAKKPAPATRAAVPAVSAASKNFEDGMGATKARADEAVALAKRNVEKASEAAIKGYDDFAVLSQENFDAFVRSNSVVAKGFETIGKEVLSFAQRSVEGQIAQVQALFGVKNMQEFVDLQNDYAKRRLEDTLAETAKLTELSTQVANEAIEPLKERVDATVETVLKAKAA